MSLLKLLFDLPDTGGQSLFTAEEQEELMAFENNLDEHLDENFSLQDNDGQFAFLHDESVPDAAPQDPMQGTSDRPVAVGDDKNQQGNNKDGVEGEGQPALGSIRIDDDPMSGHKSVNGPMTSVQPNGISAEEPGTIQKYVVSQKHADSGHAMWLKWRGKWQAGIQVSLEDCRAATVKAMPTYGRKEYLPIYLVSTRLYIWVDAQNICPLSENPEPLLWGTHSEWRQWVVDTGAPRRRMFLSLGWEMLDISDRLHILGVVERARNVSVWKEFATEAIEASKYAELGSLLVRLHAVVEPAYIRQSWTEKRLKLWTEECFRAASALTIEKLTKELIRVILWDEAATLWDTPEQPVLDPGWTDWKGPAFDDLTMVDNIILAPVETSSQPLTSLHLTPKMEKQGNIPPPKRIRKPEGSAKSNLEQSPAASSLVSPLSYRIPFYDGANTPDDYTQESRMPTPEMHSRNQAGGSKSSQQAPLADTSKTWRRKSKSEVWGCSAFVKSRKRRCPRQAWRGIYCEKHQGLAESPPVSAPDVEPSHLCMARYDRIENRRCINPVANGSYYCVLHAKHSAEDHMPKAEESQFLLKAKGEVEGVIDGAGMAKELGCSDVTAQSAGVAVKKEQLEQQGITVGARCIGRTRRSNGQCSHRAKTGSQFCEKHLKSSITVPGGSNGFLEGLFGNKSLSRLAAGLSLKDKRSLIRARDLLCKYMNASLSKSTGATDTVHCSQTLDWVVEEAAKDFPSADMLLKIVSAEKERLGNLVLEEGAVNKKSSKISWRSLLSPVTNMSSFHIGLSPPETGVGTVRSESSTGNASEGAVLSSQMEGVEGGQEFGVNCGLCKQTFEQLSLLGKHWKEQHKREASLFEKCLVCRICGKDGSNYKNMVGVVRHWGRAHPSIPMSSPGWSVCILCDKQCIDFDHLWQHLEDQHPQHWSSTEFGEHVITTLMSGQLKKCSDCSEAFSTTWDLHCHKEVAHKEQQSQTSGVKRSLDIMVDEPTGHVSPETDTKSAGAEFKYTCRFCGSKFRLLPDLGRHHQAEHKSQISEASGLQSLTQSKLAVRKLQERRDGVGGSGWPMPALDAKDGTGKKWRYRARAKSKNLPRGIPVTMKKQSGGAEAILQRMRAVKQGLEEKQKRKPRIRDRKAERARRLARLAENGGTPPPPMFKCRFCGLQFPLLPDLGRHHQAEHSAVKQAFITNSLGECQTGIYTLTKDGILVPTQGEKLKRSPNSRELLEVARSACCKEWLYQELGKHYTELPPRLFVQAAHLCSEAKVEIRWHQDSYVCPDGCKGYGASEELNSNMEVDLGGFTGYSAKASADDAKGPASATYRFTNISESTTRNCVVLSEDLSKGQERVPIACVMDEFAMEPCTCSSCSEPGGLGVQGDSQPWDDFVYVTERLLDPSLGVDTKSSQLGCACTVEGCSAVTCDHVSMFDTDNAEARTILGESIQGQFPYDSSGHIILEEGYMVYECNSSCQCKESCQNRVVQKGVCVKLEVFKSRHKGWAVRAAEPIARGTFVCEYMGEVLNDGEANRRGERYDQVGCSFLYDIDAHLDVTGLRAGSKPFVIDATKYGNVARFINHSCEPNLVNYEVLVESMDCQLAHIGFFAKRDIALGEELAYNYRYKLLPGKGYPCRCGTKSCRGRLY